MKAESLVEFGSCRNLPAVLTLVPLHTTPLCQPCCSESAFPKTRFQGWAQFILQTLLPPAGGGLDPEQEESAHSPQCRVGMLETGAKCLWEYQLVPGADCRQKEQEQAGRWEHKSLQLQCNRSLRSQQGTIIFWQERNSKSMLHSNLVAGWHLWHPATGGSHDSLLQYIFHA